MAGDAESGSVSQTGPLPAYVTQVSFAWVAHLFFRKNLEIPWHQSRRNGCVGGLLTMVIAEIGQQSAVRLVGVFQGVAGNIEESITVGATTPYGDPTYGTRYLEFTIYHNSLSLCLI